LLASRHELADYAQEASDEYPRTALVQREKILQIAARHGAHKVRVFKSVARGTARRGCDADFLVEMEEDRSVLDHAALILDLERLLKRPVDVASERGRLEGLIPMLLGTVVYAAVNGEM
jgi:predicted nucleotidyltransferase